MWVEKLACNQKRPMIYTIWPSLVRDRLDWLRPYTVVLKGCERFWLINEPLVVRLERVPVSKTTSVSPMDSVAPIWARRAITQAQRFGVEFLAPQEVISIKSQGQYKHISMADGSEVVTRSIVLSTGVAYHKLENESLDKYTGAGVYYGAATTEAYAFKGRPVYIVGGGNSAGQGAMYLSRTASEVFICVRRNDLSSTMSQYLIDQIERTPNITVLGCTEVVEGLGKELLECLVLEDMNTKERRTVKAAGLFIFIGTKPYTDWIAMDIIKDNKGFIATGRDLAKFADFKQVWKHDREPYLLETCSPGIFAAGDVRAGAMNRVASAVGEGAMAVSFVHKYLAEN